MENVIFKLKEPQADVHKKNTGIFVFPFWIL